MKQAAVIDLDDAKIILEILRNEKITGEYDLKTLGKIYRVKGTLEEIVYRAEQRKIIFEARRAMG